MSAMPDLIDVVEIAQSLESKAVFEAPDRCVVVRNRNAKCRKCVKACPADAIVVKDNRLKVDHQRCVACGACSVACPTEALVALRPFTGELDAAIADACIATQGTALFACARIASKNYAHPKHFAEVPCLARMEEGVLFELAAQGIGRILLIDGDCSTCKHRHCVAGIDETVASANTLLAAVGSGVRIKRCSAFPAEFLAEDAAGLYGAARRDFFTQARGTAKDAAGKTVEVILKGGKDKDAAKLRDRLKVSKAGTLPQFEAKRRMRILDAMDRMGGVAPAAPREMETRLWGTVEIDAEKCTVCNMCTMFCPTGALQKLAIDREGEKKPFIEFSLADCVQCRTCADICLKHCLTVGSRISLEELFDFEPRVVMLPEPGEKHGALNGLGR